MIKRVNESSKLEPRLYKSAGPPDPLMQRPRRVYSRFS